MNTPARQLFEDAYQNRTAPWVIGEPQPAIVALEATGAIRGAVLDIGCGLGEHTIMLTRLGYDVVGVDYAEGAVAQARENAAAAGVEARFAVGDAMALGTEPAVGTEWDTILDSALFHIFGDDDRPRYVDSLRRGLKPGGVLHVLALSDAGRGFGPEVSEPVIRGAFGAGWDLVSLDSTTYRGVVGVQHAEAIGLPAGTVVDEPAWLARVLRA